jgi:hypothetical protein
MAFNKTIQMCIFDGNPNGKIMCELSNWNGRVYKVSRKDINDFSSREDSEFTGVYFLLGKDDENKDTIYVGEAERMLTRIKQHFKDTYYWNDCIIVISKDNILNKAHVKYLENKFYCLAKDACRAVVLNNTIPTCSSVSEFDDAMLVEFIENTKLLVNTLGYKVFDKVELKNIDHANEEIFYINAARGATAKGLIVSDGFMVMKDSKVAYDVTQSAADWIKNIRDKLIEKGVIGQNFIFNSDYIFTSPSVSAAVVMGRNANGRTEWRNSNGKSIKDIEERT